MGNLISISTPTPTPWPAPLTSAAAQRGPHTVGATPSCGATGKVYISLYRYIHIYIHFIFIICILFIYSYLFIFIHIHSYSFIFIHIHIFVLYAYYISLYHLLSLSGHDTLAEIPQATYVFVENHQRLDMALFLYTKLVWWRAPKKNGSQSLRRL